MNTNKPLTTVALINQKGGCGKTTSATSLAACLAQKGLRTAIVDLDPQCNATSSFGLNPDELREKGYHTVADIFMSGRAAIDCLYPLKGRLNDNLSVIAGHRGLSSVYQRLEAEVQGAILSSNQSDLEADDIRNANRFKLRNSLQTLSGDFDILVLDTPPELGFLLTASLIAATSYIIPVKPSGYDLSGLDSLSKTLRRVNERLNPNLRCIGVLPTMVDKRAKLDRDIRVMLEQKFGKEVVFATDIDSAVAHRQCTVSGLSIIELEPGSKPANQYLAMTDEVLERLGMTPGQEPDYVIPSIDSDSNSGSTTVPHTTPVGEGTRPQGVVVEGQNG